MIPARLVAGTAAALLSLSVLAACGSDSGSDAASGDGWSYTSGDGKEYTADEVPTRILAQGEAAAALLSFGIKPVGMYLNEPLKDNKSLKNFDVSGIEIVGETWGQIDVEKAAALKPDLIVGSYWPVEKAYSGFEDGVEEDSKKVAKLATVVGPTAGESVQTMIEGFEDLAVSLGADLDNDEVAASKADFEKAKERFESVVAEKDGLTALAVSPADDLLYVAVPEHAADLTDFADFGLDLIVPDEPNPDFPYWENLSWENADKYQPDLVLLDDRDYEASVRTAEKQPTWKTIKAVEAGATVKWPAYWIHTWADYAEQLNLLSDGIEKADPDLT